MNFALPLASGNIVNDLLGCFGLEKESSVYLCTSDKGVIDVMDRQAKCRNTRDQTYDQGAYEILDTVGAEVEVCVCICVGELCQR
jgi:hypothetical protein